MAQAMIEKLARKASLSILQQDLQVYSRTNVSHEQNASSRLTQWPNMLHLQQTLHQQRSD